MNDRPDENGTPENDAPQVNHYNGPVFNGSVSRGQFAWDNETVTQNQQNNGGTGPVAPGYEALAERVNELLRRLPEAGFGEQDRRDTQEAAEEVLAVISQEEPVEEGRVRRALTTLRGALAPVATGIAAGATVGAQEWALAAITGLTGL
ncbi:hypothetical protein PV371_03575 [Streptomyces sp. TX20-6-3]|uniref:hypothetical protein n=1 Tax=Streptomyces sp. TX20-6-3 TaxID=3028705 RepID=UPI0029BF8F89|nr:hypothetical protein [Streptomyces sp. TX20-6-3]MDX2558729.1 hypothetical protein [Streptomyces sp. TX20-6-3]